MIEQLISNHYHKGDWDVCSPETVKELSGVGSVFARHPPFHFLMRSPRDTLHAKWKSNFLALKSNLYSVGNIGSF